LKEQSEELVRNPQPHETSSGEEVMFSGLLLVISATLVPPYEQVEDHSQPSHWAQPTVVKFERWQDEMDRRNAWEGYNRELDQLWKEYRRAGSTPRAWRDYNRAASQAKRRYVYGDPWYVPVHNPDRDRYYWDLIPSF
jgi:hypothetical protein